MLHTHYLYSVAPAVGSFIYMSRLICFERVSQPTHMITGRWSEMAKVRIAECISGWRLVDT